MEDNDEELPKDAKIVKSLLKSMGVEDHEPRVIHKFLELWYRYVVDVLTDAQVYSEYAASLQSTVMMLSLLFSPRLTSASHNHPLVRLSVECVDSVKQLAEVCECQFRMREVLLELARNRNKIPLPKTIAGPGIPLPPDQDTLIGPNYQLAIPNKRLTEPIEETEDEEVANPNPNPSQEKKIDMQLNPHQKVSFPLPKRQKN